ncbi:MAG: hypothetical protein R3D68_08440 [Hyphomicrobiaceae bacterium]
MSPVADVSVQLALAISLAASGSSVIGTSTDRLAVAPLISWEHTADLGFTETTWLQALHHYGKAAGYAHLAERIFETSSGKYYIPVAADRLAIRALQRDPTAALRVAAAQSLAHSAILKTHLGRAPTMSELYIAHVLGCEATARFVAAAAAQPDRTAAEMFPDLALAAPRLFFHGATARSVAAVMRTLRGQFERGLSRLAHSHTSRPSRAAWHTSIETARSN